MSLTSIAGTREELFVDIQKTTLLQNSISSLMVHTFKPNFAYSFQITTKYWTLIYINGSF